MKPTAVEWISFTPHESGLTQSAPAPLLSIVLESAGRKIEGFGIVDSGSDLSCIPRPIATRLRLPLEDEPREVEVLGGSALVRSAFCDLRVPLATGVLTFRSVEFAVPVSDRGAGVVILGLNPLFGELEIRFQGWLRRFGIQRRMGNLGFVPGAGMPPRPPSESALAARRAPPNRRPVAIPATF